MKEAILIGGPYHGRMLSVSDNTTRIVMSLKQDEPKVLNSSFDDIPLDLPKLREVVYKYKGRHVESDVLGFEVVYE